MKELIQSLNKWYNEYQDYLDYDKYTISMTFSEFVISRGHLSSTLTKVVWQTIKHFLPLSCPRCKHLILFSDFVDEDELSQWLGK